MWEAPGLLQPELCLPLCSESQRGAGPCSLGTPDSPAVLQLYRQLDPAVMNLVEPHDVLPEPRSISEQLACRAVSMLVCHIPSHAHAVQQMQGQHEHACQSGRRAASAAAAAAAGACTAPGCWKHGTGGGRTGAHCVPLPWHSGSTAPQPLCERCQADSRRDICDLSTPSALSTGRPALHQSCHVKAGEAGEMGMQLSPRPHAYRHSAASVFFCGRTRPHSHSVIGRQGTAGMWPVAAVPDQTYKHMHGPMHPMRQGCMITCARHGPTATLVWDQLLVSAHLHGGRGSISDEAGLACIRCSSASSQIGAPASKTQREPPQGRTLSPEWPAWPQL